MLSLRGQSITRQIALSTCLWILGVGLIAAVPLITPGQSLYRTTVAMLSILAVLVGIRSVLNQRAELLSPSRLPLAMVAAFTALPALILYTFPSLTGATPALLAVNLTAPAMLPLAVAPMLFLLGTRLAGLASQIRGGRRHPAGSMKWHLLDAGVVVSHPIVTAARVVLVAILSYRLYQLASNGLGSFANVRGFDDTLAAQLETIIAAALVVAVIVLASSPRTITKGRILARADWCLVLAISAVTLGIGSRAELVPIFIYLAFARQSAGRRHARTSAVLGGSMVFVALATIGAYRGGDAATTRFVTDPVRGLLSPVSSPLVVQQLVYDHLDLGNAKEAGATYTAALLRLPPEPLLLADDDQLAGALEFRANIQEGTTSGLGFAPAAEALLNFGQWAAVLIWVLIGMGLGWLYRASLRYAGVASLVYPIVVCTLPYGLRADFLAQVKFPIYVLALLLVISILSKDSTLVGRPRMQSRQSDRYKGYGNVPA